MPRRPRSAVVTALTLAVLVAGCTTSSSTLLNASDFRGVAEADHGPTSMPPGRTWCSELSITNRQSAPQSTLVLSEDGWTAVGAVILVGGSSSAAELLDELEEGAADCLAAAESAEGYSIEQLTGLEAGAVGWRTSDQTIEGPEGGLALWGEYVALPLDGTHLLAVGFETDEQQAPVELDELVRLAREGVERVGLGG